MLFNLKTTTLAIASLAVLVVATPAPQNSNGQCNTGDLMCCENTQNTAPSPKDLLAGLLSILGINLQSADLPIGLTCSPITVSVCWY